MNACKLGRFCKSVLRPNDDPAELKRLIGEFRFHYRPVGRMEEGLLDEIAATKWRILRCCRIETDTLQLYGHKNGQPQLDAVAFAHDQKNLALISKLPPWEERLERKLASLTAQLDRTQTERKRQTSGAVKLESAAIPPL